MMDRWMDRRRRRRSEGGRASDIAYTKLSCLRSRELPCSPKRVGARASTHSPAHNKQKDKNSGQSAGYGFVKFVDRRCANLALQYLQAKVFYGQELRVNWAFQSHQREVRGEGGERRREGLLCCVLRALWW